MSTATLPVTDFAAACGIQPTGSVRRISQEALMLDATSGFGHDTLERHGRTTARRKPAEYRVYYAIVFAVALPIAVIRCLAPRTPGYLESRGDEGRGVLAEARALTNTVVPYLFMG